MSIGFFLKGLVIGFSIAAPVGPIGMLCLRRTLAEGRLSGFVSGLGAATADAFYGFIAGFGLTAISTFLVDQQAWLRLIGGVFLIFLGVRYFLSKPREQSLVVGKGSVVGGYVSTLFLTLTNPVTILSFAGIFAGLGLGSTSQDYGSAIALVAGVFTGSAAWWFVLSAIASLFRAKVTFERLRWVNRISGIIIAGFGVAALVSLL